MGGKDVCLEVLAGQKASREKWRKSVHWL